tara:strand:- start:21 stop:1586 length:1566 start_codon:yes stop_codon:yes gene_type:complete
MRLTSGGNLLINRTSDAGSRVQVDGEIRIYNANFDINSDSYGYRFGAGDCGIFHTGYNMTFKNYNGSSLQENMRLTSAGNLLIGTTTDSGYKLTVNGDIKLNDNAIRIGSSSLGDLKIYHSTNSFIQNDTGDLYITQTADDKDIIFQSDDGSGGVTEYFKLDGSLVDGSNTLGAISFPDKSKIFMGAENDIRIYHDSSNSYFQNTSGDIIIQNFADDKDIIFKSDDGSGGTTAYITLDGSQTTINLEQNVLIGTTTDSGEKLVVQDSAQAKMRLVSDGNNGARFDLHSSGGGRYSLQALSNGDFFMFDEASGHTVQRYFNGAAGAWTWYTVGAEKMRLTSGGNLLIGTTTDSGVKLEVSQETSTTNDSQNVLKLTHTTSGTTANGFGTGIGFFSENSTYSTINEIGRIEVIETHEVALRDDMLFYTKGDNVLSEKLRIKGNGNLLIGTTTDSGFYKLDVNGKQRVQSVLELDDVLTLNAISTPSDPANNKSSIYMDSADGSIKVKINVGGTVVTRTIASFE